MPRFFIHMAYDGTRYKGWQLQPDKNTVQQVMEDALGTLLKQEIAVTGAGRTDTGVHASFFIAHFDMPGSSSQSDSSSQSGSNHPDSSGFIFRLNRFLPPDIVVYKIEEVPPDMHARFSATYRTYHYHISSVKPLFTRNYSHYIFGPLSVEKIDACCRIIMETVDFTSFSKLHSDVKTHNCRIFHAKWKVVQNGYLLEITADRFLRNMVRSLVGTLLDVGLGKISPEQFRAIVDARDRQKAGQSAPARGLFLVNIGYGEYTGPL